jgi:tetratricopeptide (TPR) repeat protein
MPTVDRSSPVKLLLCLLLIVSVWGVFGQAAHFPFVNYDDPAYTNPVIAQGFTPAGFRYAFTFGEIGHWHPVTWISHMADFQLYGAGRPGAHHVTSIVLHGASAVLLCLLLSNVTGAFAPSAFVAFVFAIHPLRAESVVWIAERKDVLSGFFFVLTLAAYVAYVRRRRVAWYAGALLLYALGLMSKNMLVTLPFVLLLLDYWPLRRELTRKLFVEKIPFFVLAAVSIIITLNVPERLPSQERVSFVERLQNAVVTPARYLFDTVYPRDLAVYYPYRPVPSWELAAAFLMLIAITAAAVLLRKRAPYVFVGWFWYLVMLAPVAGIVQISNYSHADRYTYLPQIGLSLAVAWLAWSAAKSRPARAVLACLAALAIVGLAVKARAQTGVWSDSASLWTHDLAVAGPNAVAYHGLGASLMSDGKTAGALHDFQLAIQADPNYFPAHRSLGQALVASGRIGEAVPHFEEAIRLWPSFTLAHVDLGNALLTRNRAQDALAHFEEARRLRPDSYDTILGIGNAQMQLGRPEEAFRTYREALDLQPQSVTALANAGSAAAAAGHLDEGTAYLREAIRLNPALPEAHKNLGLALTASGNADGAISEYRLAIQYDPANVEAYVLLGSALGLRHEMPEATSTLEKAAALDRGEHAVILDRLAAVYAMSGRFADAARAANQGAAIAERQGDAKAAASLRNDVKEYASHTARR